MKTANAVALGIITLAIVAVLVQGQGGTTMINAIGGAIAWASNSVNSLGQTGAPYGR